MRKGGKERVKCDCQVWGNLLSSFLGSSGKVFGFRSITLKFSKIKEFPESGQIKGDFGKDEDLKTPAESKFLCAVA